MVTEMKYSFILGHSIEFGSYCAIFHTHRARKTTDFQILSLPAHDIQYVVSGLYFHLCAANVGEIPV